MSNERFTDQVVFVKTNPQIDRELSEGITAALAGDPPDESKSGSWQRGHQIGTYRRQPLPQEATTTSKDPMKAVLVRIGVDQAYGKWNAPVDPVSERFIYLPIPESAGTRFHPDLERRYTAFLPDLERFCTDQGQNLRSDLRFPLGLHDRSVHHDPDFKELTYGDDGARRGAAMKLMKHGDLIVFYAGLRPIAPCEHKLLYALAGLFVVDEVVDAAGIPEKRWHQNAHTRKSKQGETDIVVRAVRGKSGRLERCIPIGEWRDRAYRVRNEVLEAWGGLSVKDGYIQRSIVPPAFLNPQRFYEWFTSQGIPLLERDN